MDSKTARIFLTVVIVVMLISACTGKDMIKKESKVSPITIETKDDTIKKITVLDQNGETIYSGSGTIIKESADEVVIQTEYLDE